jgi:hypothetical protein
MDDRIIAPQPEIGPAWENSESSDSCVKSTFFNYPVWTDYSGLFPSAAVAAGVIVTARSLLLRGNLNERLWNVCCT